MDTESSKYFTAQSHRPNIHNIAGPYLAAVHTQQMYHIQTSQRTNKRVMYKQLHNTTLIDTERDQPDIFSA